ncbi:MAG TPA: recombinase family protein [Symbiobacteriaceae bacterium]|jgi:site-specific DNA recombinase
MFRDQPIRAERVAVYIRWSTDDQSEGTTLDVQRDACRHFILSQGWEFRADLLFVDDGYTGANTARPGLERLRHLCRQGDVDCVVVYKLDRLSRSVVDTVKLVMEEWEGGVCLKSAREPIDTSTPMGKQIFYLLVSYAEWERNVIKERTLSGKWKRAQEGKCPGFPAPYGYRNAGTGVFAVDPAEAPVVKRIFDAAAGDRSAKTIAADLNRDGVPARKGQGWSNATVCRLLRNPSYMGVLEYGRTSVTGRGAGGSRRVTHAEAPVKVPGVFPVLVDAATFATVQAALTARQPSRVAPRSLASDALLTGLAVCGRCGQAIVSHRRWGGKYRYYRCSAQFTKGDAYCPCGFIPQQVADAEVRRRVLALDAGQERLEQHRTLCLRAGRLELERLTASLGQARVRLDEAGRREARVQRSFMTGEIDARRFNELMALVEAERREATATVGKLEAGLAAQAATWADQAARQAHQEDKPDIGETAARWDDLAPAERKSILRALLARVLLFRDRETGAVTLELQWRADQQIPAPEGENV